MTNTSGPSLRIRTSIAGANDWKVIALRGQEGLSQLYDYQVRVLAPETKPLSFAQCLGQQVTLLLGDTPYCGIVTGVKEAAGAEHLKGGRVWLGYRLQVAPKLWLLTRKIRSQIFQSQSVPDIVGGLLKQWSIPFDTKWSNDYTFPVRNYCVQYQESDFAFLSRLLEEEGIFYYFVHSGAEPEKLVLANNSRELAAAAGDLPVVYTHDRKINDERARITFWSRRQDLGIRKVALVDYSFQKAEVLEASREAGPSIDVGTQTQELRLPANDQLETTYHPGDVAKHFDAVKRDGAPADNVDALWKSLAQEEDRYAQLRLERSLVTSITCRGKGNVPGLRPGQAFRLNEHPAAAGDYYLCSVQFQARQPADLPRASFVSSFRCIPGGLPFRPARRTRRPGILGLQSAVVVGMAKDDPIFTDEYGRVKVKFAWDRRTVKDSTCSCWLRVAQPWGGQSYGTQFIPRVDDEVLVSFLNGDPDQPVIVGSLYNHQNMPPGKLPDHRTWTGIYSHSKNGHNGLFFNDQAGKEMVNLRGERDVLVHAKGDLYLSANGDMYQEYKELHQQEGFSFASFFDQLKQQKDERSSGSGSGSKEDKPRFAWEGPGSELKDTNKQVKIDPLKDFLAPVLKMGSGITMKTSLGIDGAIGIGGGLKVTVNPLAFLNQGKPSDPSAALFGAGQAWGLGVVGGLLGFTSSQIGINLSSAAKFSVGASYSYNRGCEIKIKGDPPKDSSAIVKGKDILLNTAGGAVALLITGGVVLTQVSAGNIFRDKDGPTDMGKMILAYDAAAIAGLILYIGLEMARGKGHNDAVDKAKKDKESREKQEAEQELDKKLTTAENGILDQVNNDLGDVIAKVRKELQDAQDALTQANANTKNDLRSEINVIQNNTYHSAKSFIFNAAAPAGAPSFISLLAEGAGENGAVLVAATQNVCLEAGKSIVISNLLKDGTVSIVSGKTGALTLTRDKATVLLDKDGIKIDHDEYKSTILINKDGITINQKDGNNKISMGNAGLELASKTKIKLKVDDSEFSLLPTGIQVQGNSFKGKFQMNFDIGALQANWNVEGMSAEKGALVKKA